MIEDSEDEIDPIIDIIDYLVRCANISFKNAHVNEVEVRTTDKIQLALDLYTKSPTNFLVQFGKYLAPGHIQYFDKLQISNGNEQFHDCVDKLKKYHFNKNKRIRNRRYKALQKLKNETDYFTDKQMMYRNPLLYEQLVGQYLTDAEIQERDSISHVNVSLLNVILETVDYNYMRELKNEQMHEEDTEIAAYENKIEDKVKRKLWGDFDVPDAAPSHIPEKRTQKSINTIERNMLREEFLQEMYSSFIEGRDINIDYENIDNDEQFDDLQQMSQDAEDLYFDSESNDIENLEEHMQLVHEYSKNLKIKEDSDPTA